MPGRRAEVLISPGELAGELDRVDLVDVRWRLGEPDGAGRERFLAGHLPGAQFMDLEGTLTTQTGHPTDGRHPLPTAGQLAGGLAAAGVSGSRPVVVYDEPGSFAASRAWWVLRWAGLPVRVLDGGLTAWNAAGFPLEDGDPEPPQPPAEPLAQRLTLGRMPTITADEAAGFCANGRLVDARAAERYRGEVEPIDAKAGHIPGAANVPVSQLYEADGTLPPEKKLRELFAEELAAERVAVYCGSGVSATRLVLALETLGVRAAMYPPSWSGWSSDPDRQVEAGPPARA